MANKCDDTILLNIRVENVPFRVSVSMRKWENQIFSGDIVLKIVWDGWQLCTCVCCCSEMPLCSRDLMIGMFNFMVLNYNVMTTAGQGARESSTFSLSCYQEVS